MVTSETAFYPGPACISGRAIGDSCGVRGNTTAMPHVRIRRRCWLARLAGSLGCTSPSGLPKTCSVASAVVLNAGDTLRMAFSVPPSTTADVLSYEVDYLPYLLSSGWQLSPNLYVGDRLVGSGVCNGKWQSTAAAFPLAAAPTFDFSTIAG